MLLFFGVFLADGVKNQGRIVHCVGYFDWEEKPVILKSFQVEIVIGLCCVAWASRYRINNNHGQHLLNTSYVPGTTPST